MSIWQPWLRDVIRINKIGGEGLPQLGASSSDLFVFALKMSIWQPWLRDVIRLTRIGGEGLPQLGAPSSYLFVFAAAWADTFSLSFRRAITTWSGPACE
ncbi:hypothetical protein AVEN_146060-1 [Araneus ventricosus]|uniref:Uncharacterized protein n=1 Tax=Araneus ventricosus TaxID=182803 RepID=A0A4Y2IJ09_ARAVE|nr:hypothetical protein AVEN_146060-1 [Araneus ventricosus]